jgi:hypothetical protein
MQFTRQIILRHHLNSPARALPSPLLPVGQKQGNICGEILIDARLLSISITPLPFRVVLLLAVIQSHSNVYVRPRPRRCPRSGCFGPSPHPPARDPSMPYYLLNSILSYR